MKHLILGLSILLMGLALWFLFSFVFISEEQRIYHIIQKSAKSVEKGSILYISTVLNTDYRDSSGIDKAYLLGILRDFYTKSSNRKIHITNCSITVQDNQAQALVSFQFQSDVNGNIVNFADWIIETSKSPIHYRIYFSRKDHRWLIEKTERIYK